MTSTNIRIETDRLIIRPLRLDEAQLMADVSNESIHTLQPWLNCMKEPQKVEDVRKFLETILQDIETGKGMETAIFNKQGELMGMCGYKLSAASMIEGPEIGYWLAAKYEGNGYMAEAVKAVTNYAFTEKKAERVWAWVLKGNEPSRKVLERCDFIYEACLRNAGKTPAGATCDKLIYAHTPKSWKKYNS